VIKRAIHAVVLNVSLVLGAGFYFLAPTVYAFFSEVSMTYSLAPASFARSLPARLTARLFDRYDVNSPIADRFRRRFVCYLVDQGATRDPDCMHEIRRGQTVHGPPELRIASGTYLARFGFYRNDVCSAGQAQIHIATVGRFGRVLASYAGRIEPGDRIDLPFTLRVMDAALGPVEFRIVGESDCVLLSRVELSEISLPLADHH
jgi:hypothetical protein